MANRLELQSAPLPVLLLAFSLLSWEFTSGAAIGSDVPWSVLGRWMTTTALHLPH
jgi:hypothetical protein